MDRLFWLLMWCERCWGSEIMRRVARLAEILKKSLTHAVQFRPLSLHMVTISPLLRTTAMIGIVNLVIPAKTCVLKIQLA